MGRTAGAQRVADLFASDTTLFSFEFFPPKTEKGWARLAKAIRDDFLPLYPAYVSVTYGAGGSTRTRTHDLVTTIQSDFGLTVVAHLTCVGSSREEIRSILDEYRDSGVVNVLALRGDPPASAVTNGPGRTTGAPTDEQPSADPDSPSADVFPHAADLVAFVRENYPEFSIGVAGFPEGHPATPNRLREMEYLKAKIDAGADYVVTQLFFENRDYFDFVDRARLAGIEVPIVPGIMPVASRSSMERMADLAAGARFPAPLVRAVTRAADDEAVARVGTHWATAQVADLLYRDVPGVHLYTLNHSTATIQICRNLGIENYQTV